MQNILKKFLQLNHYYTQEKDFEDYFLSHPNYPSLYAVTDTLTLIGIENIAANIPHEEFLELPESFLAIYANKFVLVEKTGKKLIISKEDGTKEKLHYEDFLDQWDGVVVAIGKNEVDNYKPSKSYLKEIVFTFLSLFFITNSLLNGTLNLYTFLGFGLSIIGLFLSVLIIEEKYIDGNENSLTAKICTFNENLSCDNVIKSQQAHFFKWIDFSDLPILFFGSSVLIIILNANFISAIGFLCLLTLPIIAYSIWLQKVVIQKWCLLCLSVSIVIIGTAIFSIPYIMKPTWKIYLLIFTILTIVSLIWFNYRSLLKTNIDLVKNNRQLLNFKRSPIVYNLLKKQIHSLESFHTIQAIEIGNRNNKINLTLILSPSCSHCHKAYEEALELMENYQDKLKLSVFFNVNPENYDNPYLKVVFNLLQIHIHQPIEITIEALNDWHLKGLTLEQWIKKWDQGDINESVLNELQLQYNWCQENNFNFTPIKIVNENVYPQEYMISELRFFISELEEELEIA